MALMALVVLASGVLGCGDTSDDPVRTTTAPLTSSEDADTSDPTGAGTPDGSLSTSTGPDSAATANSSIGSSPRAPASTGTQLVAPAPLHPSVDDWPAGTVVVDTGERELVVGVRIADTGSRRAHGLMEVPEVPDGTGMWFVHPSDTDGGYWMKDTLVDLDIAWVDATGRVVAMEAMSVCESSPCPTYPPGASYRFALEVPAGWLGANDVTVGDTMCLKVPTP